MNHIAVTVIGHDRPGIIAAATAGLSGLGLNLEDSTMTRLRGHFAMMLICSGDCSPRQVEDALAPLTADGQLEVSARFVPDDDGVGPAGHPYLLTVHGGDRTGIVSAVTREVAEAGGNITDLTTRLTGDLYVVVAEVELPAEVDAPALATRLRTVGHDLGVDVTLRAQDTDVL
ncbi:glycine cleavage system protein R [Haloactinopolyspora alba]|uniref:glycine cleavage system protein R n=1 Tax=Haloactinopolyspora alba TaxID=648780 RepID=UPI000D0D16DD|nr:ACT domain-containing protein [Haloactinopolyspora alba]